MIGFDPAYQVKIRIPSILDDILNKIIYRLVDDSGTAYEEEGFVLTDANTGKEVVIAKKGTYIYPDKDGKLKRFTYDVDEPVAGANAQWMCFNKEN